MQQEEPIIKGDLLFSFLALHPSLKVRLVFDLFLSQARPGLATEEEVEEVARRRRGKRNSKRREKEKMEAGHMEHELARRMSWLGKIRLDLESELVRAV